MTRREKNGLRFNGFVMSFEARMKNFKETGDAFFEE